VFSSESGFFCNLYSPETRCEACKSLQGVILYPLGPESVESVVIDVDLKELWHKVKILLLINTVLFQIVFVFFYQDPSQDSCGLEIS
jgi:hypothetical protein